MRAEERKRVSRPQLGAGVQPDEELLNTLVYLTEYPTAIRGSFDPSYLELPREILVDRDAPSSALFFGARKKMVRWPPNLSQSQTPTAIRTD